jgi:hypothetical protein
MTITLGPELEAALSEAARRDGVSPDALALNVLRERFLTPAQAIPLSPDEWRQRILETAGKWRGPFERPKQGEYEQREPLA